MSRSVKKGPYIDPKLAKKVAAMEKTPARNGSSERGLVGQ